MAELLRRVHALPIPQPPRVMSAGAWISHYAAAAARRKAGVARSAALRANAMTHLGRLGATPAPPAVLCHSDLHRLNIVDDRPGGGLILLDWEYAHVADGFWDLAGWIANNDWTEDTAARLLRSYLRRAAFPAESARLGALRWLYDYVCLQWSEIYLNQRAGPDSDEVDARAERLAERLGCGSGGRAG
jgi:thiamine kinase-like enzyme